MTTGSSIVAVRCIRPAQRGQRRTGIAPTEARTVVADPHGSPPPLGRQRVHRHQESDSPRARAQGAGRNDAACVAIAPVASGSARGRSSDRYDYRNSMRAMIIAHFLEVKKVRIEDEAFIGPDAIVLPWVMIGRGAVETAGSVVTRLCPSDDDGAGKPRHSDRKLRSATDEQDQVSGVLPETDADPAKRRARECRVAAVLICAMRTTLPAPSMVNRGSSRWAMTWYRCKTLAIASIVAALLLADAGGWLLNRPPNTDCLPEASAPRRMTEARAVKAVVQPWRGPHHVYGLFIIPNQFVETKRYAVTISVEGVLQYCMWVEKSLKQRRQVISVERGEYLVREYVPTRVALWFLINGLFGDLRRPENWAIVFSDRRS